MTLSQVLSSRTENNSAIAIVIPAGGGGTRLWPRSRQDSPKQFLDVVTRHTMLQDTVNRIQAIVPPDRVYVITSGRHVDTVRRQLSDVPADNIVGEPQGRDSAPAVGLMAALLERQLGPDTIMAVLPSDHVILDEAAFREALLTAARVAEAGYLVTLGIPPKSPDTGFGYIRAGEPLAGFDDERVGVRNVLQFREKPKHEVAVQYLAEGGYYWNAGMFIATVGRLRNLYRTYVPAMEPAFAKIADAFGTEHADAVMRDVFPTIDKISFDYAIAEKADSVAVIPADIGWSDVGSWGRLAEVLSEVQPAGANIVVGHHVGIDTHDALIYSPNRLIATIGLDNIVVIDTPDALLICPKSRSEEVKHVVDALKARGDHHLL
ncbi:MAG: mannose-1-phosphate guanylyltransferase [Capsulimonadaceae bacterium]